MIWRIALGLATSRASEHRWRRIAIPIASAVFMVCVLASASLLRMDERNEERLWNRSGLIAGSPAPTDLFMALSFDDFGDDQFTIIWVEPAGSQPPVLPAGLSALPEPGTMAVSPALARKIETEPALAERYPSWTVLDKAGVVSNEELFGYARPAAGRATAREEGAVRISSFATPGATVGWSLDAAMGRTYLFIGAIVCLVLPSLLVLGAGLTSASTLRDRRMVILRSIGLGKRAQIQLSMIEALLLSLPGIAIAVLAWAITVPRLGTVPIVGDRVFTGDLGLGALDLGIVAVFGIAALIVMAWVITAWALSGRRIRPRPMVSPGVMSWLRFVPALIATGLFGLSMTMLRTELGELLFLLALALSIVSVPFLYAGLVKTVGAELATTRRPAAMLAGRQLSWDPVRLTRPYAALGTVVMIAMTWMGFAAFLSSYENPSFAEDGVSTATVSWADPRPEDVGLLQEALASDAVFPMRYDGPSVLIGATCGEIAAFFASDDCAAGQPYVLPEPLQRRLAEITVIPAPYMLAAPASMGGGSEAFVLGHGPVRELDERAGQAAWRLFPIPGVLSFESFVKRSDDRNAWLIGGVIGSLFVLAMASILALIDRLIANRLQRTVLLRIGLTTRRLRALEAWLFLVPYVTVFAASLAAGFGLCWLILGWKNLSPPWEQIGTLVGIALAVGVVGTLAVMSLGVATVRDQPAIRR